MRLRQSPLGKIRASADYGSIPKAAKALKISPDYLSKIERGYQTCSTALMERMASLYGVEPDEIALALMSGRKKLLKRMLEMAP